MNKKCKFLLICFISFISASQAFTQKSASDAVKKAIANKKNAAKNPAAEKTPVVFNEDFSIGEELFSLNEPAQAIPYFEKAIDVENVNPAIYIYLGVCYYQTGDYNKSLAVCVKGLAKENTDHKVLAYNAGNSCYAMGNYMRADASYAIAIREDPSYAPAVLNRANAQLKLDHLEDSKNNYIKYLELDPETEQRERIELLIKLLEQEIELRANQKPEMINPDEFVENEKMETGDIPELVALELPVYEEEKKDEPEKVEFDTAIAPAIPEDQLEIVKAEETLADESAPELPVEEIIVAKVDSEKVRETVPALPVEKEAENVAEDAAEKLGELELPFETVEVSEAVEAEKIDGRTIQVEDYEKVQAELERLKKEKLAAEQAAKEQAEKERAKLLKQIEKEQLAASTVKVDDDDARAKPETVPDKVEVKENADGTVDIKIPTLSFKVNSSELTNSASNNETINKVYEILSDNKYSVYRVKITGYVNPDNDEWTEDEKVLALKRAQSVKKQLVDKGIDEKRLEAVNGSGKTENKEYNRRVEFLLTK